MNILLLPNSWHFIHIQNSQLWWEKRRTFFKRGRNNFSQYIKNMSHFITTIWYQRVRKVGLSGRSVDSRDFFQGVCIFLWWALCFCGPRNKEFKLCSQVLSLTLKLPPCQVEDPSKFRLTTWRFCLGQLSRWFSKVQDKVISKTGTMTEGWGNAALLKNYPPNHHRDHHHRDKPTEMASVHFKLHQQSYLLAVHESF